MLLKCFFISLLATFIGLLVLPHARYVVFFFCRREKIYKWVEHGMFLAFTRMGGSTPFGITAVWHNGWFHAVSYQTTVIPIDRPFTLSSATYLSRKRGKERFFVFSRLLFFNPGVYFLCLFVCFSSCLLQQVSQITLKSNVVCLVFVSWFVFVIFFASNTQFH